MMAFDEASELDIYISYHEKDVEFMHYLFDRLEKNDMKVWAKGIDKCEGSKGTALINSKLFMVIMSADSMGQTGLIDEVSLAYISDKPIFPVAMLPYDELKPCLTFSMRLILGKINWTFFTSEKEYKTQFPNLLSSIADTQSTMEEGTHVGTADTIQDELDKPEEEPGRARIFKRFRRNTRKYQRVTDKDFWDAQFGSKKGKEVSWIDFRKHFLAVYDEHLKKKFPDDKITWLMNVAYGDIFRLHKQITKKMYENFAGRFKNATVIASLLDLLNDKEANMRAVAAIALGKTGIKSERVVTRMLKMLEDDDRLVREAACISLGHMQSEAAVPYLVSVWRKEIISHVRNAAEVALGLIDSDQSREALRVVKVLSEEMKDLKDHE